MNLTYNISNVDDKNIKLGKKLSVYDGKIPSIKTFYDKITSLNISFCHIRHTIPQIGKLFNLRMLDCSNNLLETLPIDMYKLKNLTHLYCNFNMIKKMSDQIGDLKRLETFDFSYNLLTEIPSQIGNNISLRNLIGNCNNIRQIPKEIGKINKLTLLKLRQNHLTSLPFEIGKLINLVVLDCSENKISVIPWSIKELKKLQELNLGNNKLLAIPREIGELDSLVELNVKHNYLENMINNMKKLTNLHFLDFSDNIIRNIPYQIGCLKNLREFNCSINCINVLPIQLGKLNNMVTFNCSENYIRKLPHQLGNLPNLVNFIFARNQIVDIPPNMVRFADIDINETRIYFDEQNVHDHNIQEGIRESISNLMSDQNERTEHITEMLENDVIAHEVKTLILEFCSQTDIHTILNISFGQVFERVWGRIMRHKDRNEILGILNIDMLDSSDTCFTGRISRLINCLSGFYDDIKIKISDNDQINNIIIVTRKRLARDYLNLDHENFIKILKENVKNEMRERNYSEQIIDDWIKFIE